jgi:predicted deacylase
MSDAMTDPAAYPIEIEPLDIEPYRRGNTGVEFATTFDSGVPGLHVMLNALTHGNELCGAVALDYLFRAKVRPRKGKLTLSFANVEAYRRFDRAKPTASRFVDEDFNRVWSEDVLDGPRDTVELRRARAMRPLVDTVDLLLDIHSMQHKTPALMLAGPTIKGRDLALAVGVPAIVVRDEGHKAGRRLRDYAGFGDPASAKNALLVECGQHWEKASERVAIETALRFLFELGTVDGAFALPRLPETSPPRQSIVEVTDAVTVNNEDFAFVRDFIGMEVIDKAGTEIALDGGRAVVTPYDRCVLIMPSRRLKPGQTAVRLGRYVA